MRIRSAFLVWVLLSCVSRAVPAEDSGFMCSLEGAPRVLISNNLNNSGLFLFSKAATRLSEISVLLRLPAKRSAYSWKLFIGPEPHIVSSGELGSASNTIFRSFNIGSDGRHGVYLILYDQEGQVVSIDADFVEVSSSATAWMPLMQTMVAVLLGLIAFVIQTVFYEYRERRREKERLLFFFKSYSRSLVLAMQANTALPDIPSWFNKPGSEWAYLMIREPFSNYLRVIQAVHHDSRAGLLGTSNAQTKLKQVGLL